MDSRHRTSPGSEPEFIPLDFRRRGADEQRERGASFYQLMKQRRSVRHFSPEPVPLELVKLAIQTAGTAPSGANQQPWRFVVISNPEVKRTLRLAAEREEKENYNRRFPAEWKEELRALGTDWRKEFLEIAPYIIAVFKIDYGLIASGIDDGTLVRKKHYYVNESVGIAVGVLLAALHNLGLATLTHTPSPMGFLNKILGRPDNEKPFLIIPVGYPAEGARVPNIVKKPLEEIMLVVE